MSIFLLLSIIIFSFIIIKLNHKIKDLKNKLRVLQERVVKMEECIIESNKYKENSLSTIDSEPIYNTNSDDLYNMEIQKTKKNIKARVRTKKIDTKKQTKDPFLDKSTDNKIPSKNSFLYGADDFGEMIEGVVIDEKSYKYDQKKDIDFEIL